MSTTVIRKGLSTLFKSHIIKALMGDLAGEAGKRASKVLEEHFTFTAAEMAKNFQRSYSYAVIAIGSGLATPENQRSFLKSLFKSNVSNEFSAQLEQDYLVPFVKQHKLADDALTTFRQQAIEQCQTLAKLSLFQGEERVFSEAELASFISPHDADSLTDLLLTLIQQQHDLSKELLAYLQFKDVLAHSLLFFLHEQLRKEPRFQTTLTTLQQQGLLIGVAELKTLMQSTQVMLQQSVDEEDFAQVGELSQKLTRFKQVKSVAQQHYSEWQAFNRQFSHWSQFANLRLEQILLAMPQLSRQLKDIKRDTEQILAIVQQLMLRNNLSSQIKPRDEFTHHNSESLQLIQQAVELSRGVTPSSPRYTQVALGLGSVMSSQGDLKQAEALFSQAYQQANNDNDKALSQFNLFQIFIRQQLYDKAFSALQQAIALQSEHYALHNTDNYILQRILGAGGMGCVFLATHRLRNQQVVIKCFWEIASGTSDALFKEAFLMAKIAGTYIPQPLDYGFADPVKRQRGFFVAEYIPKAIDGEAWLAKHGALAVKTALGIGLQIAKGLQLAHQQDIVHLDLKPANILLKPLDNKNNDIQVKIIDFGLAHTAPSLGQEVANKSRRGLSLLAQTAVFGTLDYAPPEQQGMVHYGLPSAKSDVYSFGKTLYRFLTGESPQTLNPKRFEHLALFGLLCDCVDTDPQQRPTIQAVIEQLIVFLEQLEPKVEPEPESDPEPELEPTPDPKPEPKSEPEPDPEPAAKPRRWLKVMLGIVVSGGLLAAWLQSSKSNEQTQPAKTTSSTPVAAVPQPAKPASSTPVAAVPQPAKPASSMPVAAVPQPAKPASSTPVAAIPQPAKPATTTPQSSITPPKRKKFEPEMIKITGGTFEMGCVSGKSCSSDEKPVHSVTIGDFYMGKYEVTFAQWDACVEAKGCSHKPDDEGWGRGNRPVINVSWNDANEYVQWLSKVTGKTYRLPTEAEWEYAARAGTKTKYPWGDTITHENANYGTDKCCDGLAKGRDKWKHTAPVGQFEAYNGLYDMHGNVWEWTCSAYSKKYNGSESKCINANTNDSDSQANPVLRGGSWIIIPNYLRSATRFNNYRDDRTNVDGFRIARTR